MGRRTTGAQRTRLAANGIGGALVLLATVTAPTAASSGTTELVSVASDGAAGDHTSSAAAISADGRHVAFSSWASNLVPGTYSSPSVFVRDRESGTTELVSVASDGTPANAGASLPAISADGRYVAFRSDASNLVPGDTNRTGSAFMADVFVHDRETGVTERVSVASDGTEGKGGSGFGGAAISADGRHVAFDSGASNLVPGDTNQVWDIFVHDRETGTTERVSVASDGTQGFGFEPGSTPANWGSWFPAISADGRHVAFYSRAFNLVPGDTNFALDVFVHDRETGVTERVSVTSDGAEAEGDEFTDFRFTEISADGRHVAFTSGASDLVPGDTNGAMDIFVHDRETGTTERVSVASDGAEGNGFSSSAAISADGRHVAFYSFSTNLVPGDTNADPDAFVHDRENKTTERVSVATTAPRGTAPPRSPAISADGRHVAFDSGATNLVPGGTKLNSHVFVRTRGVPDPTPTPDPSPTEGGSRGSYPETPDDPYFGEDSADPLEFTPTQWALRKVQAPQAWQQVRGTGFGIRVAVLDTGVDLQHEDLQCAGKLDVGAGSDVVGNDSNPDDENSHGTHVAGIIGACTNNGTGVAGVAPDATLVPVRVLNAAGSGTDAQLIAGLNKAVELGVHVVNMSLGYPPGKEIINNVSAIDAAIGRARDAGIVLVAAAGNDSFPLCEYPALAEDVICVGATDPRDVKSVYSVFPNKTDDEDAIGPGMVAPGGTGAPFCDTYTENVLSTIPLEFDNNGCTDVQGYANKFGTSMASPHVAGAAALVYDRLGGERSEAAAAEVITAIIDNADDLGIPGYDPMFGWGRVNALKAVQAVAVGPDPSPTPTPTETTTASPSPTESVSASPSPSESPQPDIAEVSFTDNTAEAGQHSDETLFEARLSDSSGEPIEGGELTFELRGSEATRSFTATTNEGGVASVTPRLEEKPGPHWLTVRFAGDEEHAGDADTASFVVEKEDSALELSEEKGKDKALVAHLYDADTPVDGIAGRPIDFYEGAELIGSATTDTDGVATFTPPKQKGKPQPYKAVFEGDDFYLGSSAQEKAKGGNGGGAGAEASYAGKMLLM